MRRASADQAVAAQTDHAAPEQVGARFLLRHARAREVGKCHAAASRTQRKWFQQGGWASETVSPMPLRAGRATTHVDCHFLCHAPAFRNIGFRMRATGFAIGIGACHAPMARRNLRNCVCRTAFLHACSLGRLGYNGRCLRCARGISWYQCLHSPSVGQVVDAHVVVCRAALRPMWPSADRIGQRECEGQARIR